MATPAAALVGQARRRQRLRGEWSAALAARWSWPAALRAVRAMVVMPGLFALTYLVIGNPQMATFAAFGSFATLVMAGFGGTRRDQLVAHAGLAVGGSVLLTIGTAVNSSTALAAVVTLAVAFAVLFAGIIGPKTASGATAALLAYVLPAASPGTISMVPDRLAGWWLASVVGTVAVLTVRARPPAGGLRLAVARLADALAEELDAMADGVPAPAARERSQEAKAALRAAFLATPARPTGLATADLALDDVVEVLQWVTALIDDASHHQGSLAAMQDSDRQLLAQAAATLRQVATVAARNDGDLDLSRLEELRRARAGALAGIEPSDPCLPDILDAAFHSRAVATAVRTAGADALVFSRRASNELVAEQRLRWLGSASSPVAPAGAGRWEGPRGTLTMVRRQAGLRSVWLRNSARGALALAAAIAVADLTSVQHGFWVVLGTLSVLRANAAATGATALRAVAGTTIGFAVGAVLVLAVGTDTGVLWGILPVAVLVAAYTPGVTSVVTGQAAFTVAIAVLYNLLVPVGWKVGVVRVEDVALGCGVSLAVGLLLWPRGAATVVARGLRDAYVAGAAYLSESAEWVLGIRPDRPEGGTAAVAAGLRLEEALRGYLTEQGAKRIPKEDLWRLVGGAQRLRLTAASLASATPSEEPSTRAGLVARQANILSRWYRDLAGHIASLLPPELLPAMITFEDETVGAAARCALDVEIHLRHLDARNRDLIDPAGRVATGARGAWWH